MPTGIYEHKKGRRWFLSREIRRNKAKRRSKYLANMTESKRREWSRHWFEAGHKAIQERWNRMSTLDRKRPEEIRNKISSGRIKWWAKSKMDEEARLRYMLPAIKASQRANPSSIEKTIWKELDKLNIDYKIQISFCHGKFTVDIYIPAQRVIIECNGDYWHSLLERKKRDEKLRKYAKNNDYRLIELPEYEIRKNPEQALRDGFKKLRKEV